ncbi:PilN domain-containing protein [Virgibacillus proomii]|uniref:PilN domain-containing protein n=1 Tax=Virgibacillus proomii TaxID=84407 RepID=UPI001C1125A6|nr:PilN domain-containing protein [Virgibacillus proomii]MBU5265693.1 PilN domain-containing protein [Virgibacillus proomii]
MLPDINLLPEKHKERQWLYYSFLTSVALIVIAFGILAYFYFQVTKDLDKLTTQYNQDYEQNMALEKQLSDLTKAKGKDKQTAVEFIQSYQLHTSKLIEELTALLPENAYLSEYEYTLTNVTIQTQFETLSAASSYVKHLDDSKYVYDTAITKVEAFSAYESEENQNNQKVNYDVIPRYDVQLTFKPNKEVLLEGANNE